MTHQPRKRFGQHFLHDPGVIARIVSAIGPQPGQNMVEVGPGLGAITRPILARVGELHVVELDRDVIPRLRENCAGIGTLHIHSADALRFDFASLAPAGGLRVVGNLPYNISTPLIFHLLDAAPAIADMHFLLQKEVVERLTAAPGGGDYGRLSVMVQYRCAATLLFHVGPGAFTPPPRVDSAFVRLVPHVALPCAARDEGLFAQIVARAFSQRRKTLRNALRDLVGEVTFVAAGIDPVRRAETLSVSEFVRLADAASG